MVNETNFSRNMDVLHRSLDVSSLRARVIADNIANAETPNFKRTTVSFEAELKRALEQERSSYKELSLKKTHARHLEASLRTPAYSQVSPRRILDYTTSSKNNGNNVDIEVETQRALENQMLYALLSDSISHQFRQIQLVLR